MAAKRGLDLKVYRNTSTFGSKVWSLISNVQDLTLSLTKDEGNADTRVSEFNQMLAGGTVGSFTWKMVNNPADADVIALQAAFDANTLIEFSFADGPIATAGTKHRAFECQLFDCSEDQPRGISTINIVAKPTYTANAQGVRTTVS